jgi:hypothetical protein
MNDMNFKNFEDFENRFRNIYTEALILKGHIEAAVDDGLTIDRAGYLQRSIERMKIMTAQLETF